MFHKKVISVIFFSIYILSSCGYQATQIGGNGISSREKSKNQTSQLVDKSLEKKEILQDVNFRKTPSPQGVLIQPIIRGSIVTILDSKQVGTMIWYQVDYMGSNGWISSLAFVYDPTKASAANCDPINGYVDEMGYCNCRNGYIWSRQYQMCTLKNIQITNDVQINKFPTSQYVPMEPAKLSISPPGDSGVSIYPLPPVQTLQVPRSQSIDYAGEVYVNGYFKDNGTYVDPHTRTAPDDTKSNNFSCIYGGDC